MNFFIQSILLTCPQLQKIKKNLQSRTIMLKDYVKEFDITLANSIFLNNFIKDFEEKKGESLIIVSNIISDCFLYSKKVVNESFAAANEILLNEIFTGGEGTGESIEEIKDRIYNEEMKYLNNAINKKADGIDDKRKILSEELFVNITEYINSTTKTASEAIMNNISYEFQIYLNKLSKMNESGNITKIIVDKTGILELTEAFFNKLPNGINKIVTDVSDQFILTSKEKCQEEDVTTLKVIEEGTKKLKDSVLNAVDENIVDNYREIVESVKKDVLLEFNDDLFKYLDVHMKDIPNEYKKLFDSMTAVIESGKSEQLNFMRESVKIHNDELVEEILLG